jgi:hypothetical protein
MAIEIILYNLAPHVTDEEFKEYVDTEKGPPSTVPRLRSTAGQSHRQPLRVVLSGTWDRASEPGDTGTGRSDREYRAFSAKMAGLTSEIHVTFGEQIH